MGCVNFQCEFSAAKNREGLPVLFVDEQIYRELRRSSSPRSTSSRCCPGAARRGCCSDGSARQTDGGSSVPSTESPKRPSGFPMGFARPSSSCRTSSISSPGRSARWSGSTRRRSSALPDATGISAEGHRVDGHGAPREGADSLALRASLDVDLSAAGSRRLRDLLRRVDRGIARASLRRRRRARPRDEGHPPPHLRALLAAANRVYDPEKAPESSQPTRT